MTEEITASYAMTVDMFMPAFKWHHRLLRQSSKAVWVLTAVVGSLMLLRLLSPSRELPISPLLVALPFGMLLLTALLPWLGRSYYAGAIRKSRSHGQHLTFHISEGGVQVLAPDSKSEHGWASFQRSLITPDGVLLYQTSQLFNWFPRRAFPTESDYTRFLALITAKTKHSQIG